MRQLEFFEAFFDEYTTGFEDQSEELRRGFAIKKIHSLEVYKFAKRICVSLELSEADYLAAMTSALFHDIGRFEQFKHFKTYVDRDSVNHAAKGVRVLRELGILNDFPPEARRDILAAIACHSKPYLPERLSQKATLYCQIARDADKLDIFRVVIEVYEAEVNDPVIMLNLKESNDLSPEIAAIVVNGGRVPYIQMRTTADFKMLQLGWFDELVYPESLKIALENNFANRILKVLPDTAPVREVKKRIESKFAEVRS